MEAGDRGVVPHAHQLVHGVSRTHPGRRNPEHSGLIQMDTLGIWESPHSRGFSISQSNESHNGWKSQIKSLKLEIQLLAKIVKLNQYHILKATAETYSPSKSYRAQGIPVTSLFKSPVWSRVTPDGQHRMPVNNYRFHRAGIRIVTTGEMSCLHLTGSTPPSLDVSTDQVTTFLISLRRGDPKWFPFTWNK